MKALFGIKSTFLCMIISLSCFFWIFCNFYLAFITLWPETVWPFPQTIELRKLTIENTKKIYPGETINYTLSFDKKTSAVANVSRLIVNDRIFQFSDFQSNMKPGEDEVLASITLPITAIPGPHVIRWTACYKDVLPFKNICKTIESDSFMVYAK